MATGTPMRAQFDVGNSSTVRKRISVLIVDSDFSDISVCTYWLPPLSPLRAYTMRTHTTKAWNNAAIYFYAATEGSNGGAYRLDNVSLNVETAGGLTDQTECTDPAPPVAISAASGPELPLNGSFATGALDGWSVFGQLQYIFSGSFYFYRPPPSSAPAGVVFQPTGTTAAAGTIITARFQLANTSNVRKRVTVLLHDLDFSDVSACTYWIPPGRLMSSSAPPYVMRSFATKNWANATISIYAATVDNLQWTGVDDVSLKVTPGIPTNGTNCGETGSSVASAEPPAGSRASLSTAGTESVLLDSFRAPGAGAAGLAPAASGWGVVEDQARARLMWWRLFDLGDAPAKRLRFESSLTSRASLASIQASADGTNWQTVCLVPATSDWTEFDVDLSAMGDGLVWLRFVFDAEPPLPGWPPDRWRVRAVVVR